MTSAEKRRLVLRVHKALVKAFGLQHYDIELFFRYDEDNYGTCNVENHYERATININIDKHDNVKDIIDTMLHEYVHIPMDPLAKQALSAVKKDKWKLKQVNASIEAAVTWYTRILMPLMFDFVPSKAVKKPAKKKKTKTR